MPLTNQIERFDLPGWVQGLNADADPYQLALDEVAVCQNVEFGLRGAVSKRPGYASYETPSIADKFERIVRFSVQGGSDFLVAVDDGGDTEHGTGASFTNNATNFGAATGQDDYSVGAAIFENKLYLTCLRSGSTPESFDGTTWATVTATVFDGTASRFPRAEHLLAKHERMFAANVENGATAHRSRLYWSNAADAETWDAADNIDFTPDDGQEITAIADFGEDIVVFKNHSVQLLGGASEASFTRFVLDSQLGTTAARSVVSMGERLIFFDPDNGIWAFDGAGFDNIGEKITNHVLDGMNYANAYKSSAFAYRGKYYLSVPWGSDTYPSRMFVWDERTKAWTEWTYGVKDAALRGTAVYGVSPSDAEGIHTLLTGLDDDGAAYTARFRTPWMETDTASTKSRVRRLDTAWGAKGNFNITVRLYRDFNLDYQVEQTVNTDAGGALWDTAVWDTDVWDSGVDQVFSTKSGWGKNRFRVVAFEIESTAAADDWQINRMTMHASSLGRVRGED